MSKSIPTHTECAGCLAIRERGDGGQAYRGYDSDAPLVYLCNTCFAHVLRADRIVGGDHGAALPRGHFYLRVE